MRAGTERALSLLLLFLTGLALSSCAKSHLCGGEEICNYLDDDCDGVADDPFRDEEGRYFTIEHCGGCGVDCASAFPSAEQVECVEADGAMRCAIATCPSGTHLVDDSHCAMTLPVACLPCESDADCHFRDPHARCGTEGQCIPGCVEGSCPEGFMCSASGLECVKLGDPCACPPEIDELEIACIVDGPLGRCAGARLCTMGSLGECLPLFDEFCNGIDDDCDGLIDETFRDDLGRYVHADHCGACNQPCVAPGPHLVATCDASTGLPTCVFECEVGFVDVDGFEATGCECELWDGQGPPPSAGGDFDCDGIADTTDDFIFVSVNGNDAGPGTLEAPMRTISAAVLRGETLGKDVLVSQGDYEGLVLARSGVSIYGGYREDFADRDLGLFPVRVISPGPGEPALRAPSITAPAVIAGLTIVASAANAGQGSTGLYVDESDASLVFRDLIVLAAKGGDGRNGTSSAQNLGDLGFTSLAQLTGASGASGVRAHDTICSTLAGGGGGAKSCGEAPVSGGRGGDGACPPVGCVYGSPCGNSGCTDFTVGGVCDYATMLSLAVPNPPASDGLGIVGGEAGEVAYASPTNWGVCNYCDNNPTLNREGAPGGRGGRGADGEAGFGCASSLRFDSGRGTLHGGGGGDGTAGAHGSGGGGGSSGGGYTVMTGTSGFCSDRAGGSGGGGGSGGCGAPRTTGGTGGGVSAGVVVVLAASGGGPAFENVRVVTASGGHGGDGGDGAAGGHPGAGATGGEADFWCAHRGGRGGDGGQGGAAGGAGGGCGGGAHAAIVAGSGGATSYAAMLEASLEILRAGVAGRGGRGGSSPGTSGSDGQDGDDSSIRVIPPF
jgi:hypothetical protein